MCIYSVFTAIKSLDSLNDQLIQFIFTPKSPEHDSEHDLAPRDREKLKSSMAIMRRLLVEAQTKFRKVSFHIQDRNGERHVILFNNLSKSVCLNLLKMII